MKTRLTLTIDKRIIESAKKYSNQNGISLSYLVENYLEVLIKKEHSDDNFSPKVKELMGSIKLPKDFDYKKELSASRN